MFWDKLVSGQERNIEARTMGSRLYVGNISYQTTEVTLRDLSPLEEDLEELYHRVIGQKSRVGK